MGVTGRPPATAVGLILCSVGVVSLTHLLATRPDGARWLIVLSLGTVLVALSLVRPGLAAVVVLTGAPFLVFLRRAVYALSPYTTLDPILLLAPAVCALLVSVALVTRRPAIAAALRASYASRVLAGLLVVFGLQILNPLQGGLLVGLGGALFYLAPLCWFVIGRLYADRRAAGYLLGMLVVVAVITSAHGLRQLYLGFLPFEQYWLEHGGYAALSVNGAIRPVSTFASSAEYVTFGAGGIAVAAAMLLYRRGRLELVLLPFLPVVGWAVLTNGSRGVIVRLAAAVIALIAIRGQRPVTQAAGAAVAVVVLVLGLSRWSYAPGQYLDLPVAGPFLERQAAGLSDPFGAGSTLPAKVQQLRTGLVGPLLSYPLGLGLGSASLASAKFGGVSYGLELDLTDAFVAGGLAGGLLYLALTVLLLRQALRLWRARRDWRFGAIIALFVVIVGSALAGGHYALVPLWWTLMGWLDGEYAAAWPVGGDRPLRPASTLPRPSPMSPLGVPA